MRKIIVALSALLAALVLAGCLPESDVASENVSTAADNFEIQRRVVFVNGITDTYLLEIEGRCSITDEGNQLEVICKVGEDQFIKHFLGLSDNVTYFAEQVSAASVDTFHYRVNFRPEVILPYIDLETSVDVEGDG